jgi:L,D-transpeptidase ErfK/SrfK
MYKTHKFLTTSLIFCGLTLSTAATSAVFNITPNTDVVGQVQLVTTRYEDSFVTLAQKYNIGFQELVQANPHTDPWLPGEGVVVVLPGRFILPPRELRKGIVINVAELRMYYFPPAGNKVYTYPLGIGRERWKTPIANYSIINKQEKPTWNPPPSIHAEARAEGRTLPASVPPGPDNPLGEHAMRLSNPSYLIHGTNKPGGIGQRVSHGCLNMYHWDVKQLYSMTPVGTNVKIIHQPYKAGWANGYLWLESHKPLDDYRHYGDYGVNGMMKVANNANNGTTNIDWSLAKHTYASSLGIPTVIGSARRPAQNSLALLN